MKLQFKHQPFQTEAAAAVCDVLNGQPMRTTTYCLDLSDMIDVQTDGHRLSEPPAGAGAEQPEHLEESADGPARERPKAFGIVDGAGDQLVH